MCDGRKRVFKVADPSGFMYVYILLKFALYLVPFSLPLQSLHATFLIYLLFLEYTNMSSKLWKWQNAHRGGYSVTEYLHSKEISLSSS